MIKRILSTLFGRTVRTKDYGPAYPVTCRVCWNQVYYHVLKGRPWYTFLGVTVVPFVSDHTLSCPACDAYYPLTPNDFETAKDLIPDTRRYQENLLGDAIYNDTVREFETETSVVDRPREQVILTENDVQEQPTEREIRGFD